MIKSSVPKNYSERRTRLMSLDPDACFVFFGASELVRNYDSHYPFTQDSNFHYLTEFDEPEAALILVSGKSHLFVLDRDETREIWNGERYGTERARTVFQVDEVHSSTTLYTKLEELLEDAKRVFTTLGQNALRDHKLLQVVHDAKRFQGQGKFGHLPVYDPTPLISRACAL